MIIFHNWVFWVINLNNQNVVFYIEIKLKFIYKIKINFKDKMFPNHKNLSHQQALSHMQSLFPTLSMPSFSASSSLKTIL